MMSYGEIVRINEQATRKAARAHRVPMAWNEQELPRVKAILRGEAPSEHLFPYIGYRTPKGWKALDVLFVDKSGLGAEWEPALTLEHLAERIEAGRGYGVVEEGQFQVYLGVFERRP